MVVTFLRYAITATAYFCPGGTDTVVRDFPCLPLLAVLERPRSLIDPLRSLRSRRERRDSNAENRLVYSDGHLGSRWLMRARRTNVPYGT